LRDEPNLQKEAFDFFEKIANKNYSTAIYILGNFYRDGIATPVSNEKAVSLYTQAANLGSPKAAQAIGEAYVSGSLGLPLSIETGIKYILA
jgi:uncharacterized protein